MQKKSRPVNIIVLLAGPTASGKSRLALDLAAERDAIIVNADSMQVYRDLSVLSARPSVEEERAAAHRLYGHVDAATRYSVGAWLADVAGVLAEARAAGQSVIVVGGTGLYFKALTEGLAAVPAIPATVRAELAAEIAEVSTADLHARLDALDPEDAATVRPSDRGRIVRALEVFTATGSPLAVWKRSTSGLPLVNAGTAERLVLMPERGELHRRIAERAERMVRGGAIDEVRALVTRGLHPNFPAMKAIGVREFRDHLAGKTSLEEATAAIKTETRRYAKRQMTWFRNQMGDWRTIESASALDLPVAPA